ncbi:two-component system sensor histidine kinase QseC [Aliarcobacter faecis]|uniref:ATP-binding protein n=1 Tax=Aliarcobacter faecis TaxID=1564138 RepID=UPI0004ACB089|nr:ATP-binding protein [Aliarcobacter faecis]QKF72908.1 two-component system sensor histidine kinase QseC [Aliarcobacter faecis]
MKNLSLRLRLAFILLFLFIIASFIATSISMYQTKKSLIEMFNTELFHFAQRLSNSNIGILQNQSKQTLDDMEKYMSVDDDALTFSIFSIDGNILYTDGEDSKNFLFNPSILSSKDGVIFEENKKFRIIWMLSNNKKFVVVVASEKEFIDDLIFDILEDLIYPWLFILPFLIIITILLITKELKPLNKLSKDLTLRDAKDSSTLDENSTKELKPVIKALNSLFIKTNTMIEKERRFTSNAAHELKTPLTAIKIQTEVAKLSLDDKDLLLKSLNNIEIGVNRATRMIEQLLALSRLESINEFENISKIDWIEIINSTIKELEFKAKEKNISINFLHKNNIKSINGEDFVLSLLIRNLLDNAIKYNENGTNIKIELEKNSLIIEDNGKGINSEILENIGERFIRPTGQKQIGSGLGFSIVMQIAKLHNLHLNFENITPNGFRITIYW